MKLTDEKLITAEHVRTVWRQGCEANAHTALLEVGALIVNAAQSGNQRVNVEILRYGIEKELRKRGFDVVEPDDKVGQWTIGWPER